MRFAAFFFLLTFALASCDRSPSVPSAKTTSTTAPSAQSNTVAPASTQLRIVALSPALAIILKDLGYEDQIVGRHAYDLALDPSIPTCGELGSIDYESLIKVHPSHIFIQWGSQELPARLTELAKANNWIIRNLNPLTLDEIKAAAETMDRDVFDFATKNLDAIASIPQASVPAKPDAASNQQPTPPEHLKPPMPFEDDMLLAWTDRGPFMKSAGRILLVSGTKPIGALGPGSFHAQLIERLGATPALATGGAWITLDLEDLNKLAPDAIILFAPRPPHSPAPPAPKPEELIALFGRAGELNIPAFKNKRVALIDDPFCLTPSTAMIPIADQLADIISNWGQKNVTEANERGK